MRSKTNRKGTFFHVTKKKKNIFVTISKRAILRVPHEDRRVNALAEELLSLRKDVREGRREGLVVYPRPIIPPVFFFSSFVPDPLTPAS